MAGRDVSAPVATPSRVERPDGGEGMAFVEGGTFQMGTPSGGEDDERPVHSVTLGDFWIGEHEVTQDEWREVMRTNPSVAPAEPTIGIETYETDESFVWEAGPTLPVNGGAFHGFVMSEAGRNLSAAYYLDGEGFKDLTLRADTENPGRYTFSILIRRRMEPGRHNIAISATDIYGGETYFGLGFYMEGAGTYEYPAPDPKASDRGIHIPTVLLRRDGAVILREGQPLEGWVVGGSLNGAVLEPETDLVNLRSRGDSFTLEAAGEGLVEGLKVVLADGTASRPLTIATDLTAFTEENLPVENVSWFDAVKYCNARSRREGLTPCYTINGETVRCNFQANGYRLPTEAEWEYAARGGTYAIKTTYAGGNDADDVAWYSGNAGGKTHPVGLKRPNELGLYDMSGNVWEWCWDWYGSYASGNFRTPTGAPAGAYRVVRGGCWNFNAPYTRCANRNCGTPSEGNNYFGFRLVRSDL